MVFKTLAKVKGWENWLGVCGRVGASIMSPC